MCFIAHSQCIDLGYVAQVDGEFYLDLQRRWLHLLVFKRQFREKTTYSSNSRENTLLARASIIFPKEIIFCYMSQPGQSNEVAEIKSHVCGWSIESPFSIFVKTIADQNFTLLNIFSVNQRYAYIDR